MEVDFGTDELRQMAEDASCNGDFPQAVVKVYRKRIQFIRAAVDERDFYAMRSLHFEKLKGKRVPQRSMRLNDQWRLILEIISTAPKNIIKIIAIEDYH